ncbi:hypothetical protein IQ249_05575 [Lusitaniella coriacea LEGE 07157]|uniref:Uncharacterized protein n=2 Tax=Lusitaniella TaxID=1983104 RepID=A0A8J7B7M2_9CYAN|nr:hypothetical protein [Lusitaniella coriacea LEGE 07157]
MTTSVIDRTNTIDLIGQILSSREISRIEQQMMSALLGKEDLDEQERALIERIFYGLRHGLLRTVD